MASESSRNPPPVGEIRDAHELEVLQKLTRRPVILHIPKDWIARILERNLADIRFIREPVSRLRIDSRCKQSGVQQQRCASEPHLRSRLVG